MDERGTQFPEPDQDDHGPEGDVGKTDEVAGDVEATIGSNGDLTQSDEKGLVDDDDDDDNPQCGWFSIRPPFIQVLNSPKGYLFFLCIFAVAQGMTVNGIVYVITTTLERRFSLPSARSGFISSCYDFSVMIVIVFVTYLGEKSHKPRWIGTGAFTFAMGSFLFTLPHFATPYYNPQGSEISTCNINGTDPGCENNSEPSLSNYYWVFVAAQVLHGLGASPLYTLGVTYIDDNVKPVAVAIYIGVFQAMSTLGPALGYVFGGIFLSIYTDVKVDPDSLNLTRESPLWIGGWWMGFFLTGFLTLFVSIPLLGFPRALPGAKALKMERKLQSQEGSDFSARAGFGNKIMDFPRAAWTLIKNVPFMCLNGAAITEWFILASIAVFGPKYLESQFNFTTGTAALVAGVQVIPASLIGCLVGAYLVRHFKLEFRGMVKLCLVCLTVSLLCLFIFFVSCPNVDFAGVTVQYENTSLEYTGDEADLSASCNADCHCADNFDPVCGTSNQILYYSPCHAGCTVEEEEQYSNCQCIETSGNDASTAVSGKCDYVCPTQWVFLVFLFIMLTGSFFGIVPSLTATLRCVGHSQRAFGLGLQSLLYRALGTVPGPVVFGLLIDNSCLVWEEECDNPNSRTCWMYDNAQLATVTLVMTVALRICSILFFIGALFFYKPVEDEDAETKTNGVGDPVEVYSKVVAEGETKTVDGLQTTDL